MGCGVGWRKAQTRQRHKRKHEAHGGKHTDTYVINKAPDAIKKAHQVITKAQEQAYATRRKA